MKKTLITLLVVMGTAMAEQLTLPNYVTNGNQTSEFYGSYDAAITKVATWEYGYYVGASGGAIGSNWKTPTMTVNGTNMVEGDWNNDAVLLAGRGGAQGLVSTFVFGNDIEAGYTLSAITFNAAGYADNIVTGDITIALGIRTSTGETIAGIGDVAASFASTSTDITSITLNGSVDWQEGYRLIAVIKGINTKTPSPTTPFAITNISATADITPTIPEPTTATLSLLALAGLAARRRRK